MPASQLKISQRSAMLIERLRSECISNEQLVSAMQQRSLEPLSGSKTAEQLDLNEWLDYANEHGEPLMEAVEQGYRMTFTTTPGASNWLRFALGLEEGQHYTVSEEGRMDGLQLTEAQFGRIAQGMAMNWVLIQQPDGSASLMLRALQ